MAQSRLTPTIKVFVNGAEVGGYHPVRAQRSMGSRRLDNATIIDFRGGANSFAFDRSVGVDQGAEIEIVGDPNGAEVVYHWGTVSLERIAISQRGDLQSFVSRVEDYHFGQPIVGQVFWSQSARKLLISDAPIVFNPRIDNNTFANSDKKHLLRGGAKVFVDPGSCQTAAAKSANAVEQEDWTLKDIVAYLCAVGNPNQTYIKNPVPQLIATHTANAGTIVNLAIPHGLYLSEALDRVLNPFGISWMIDYERRGVRRIRLVELGANHHFNREVLLQRVGETVDHTQSNVAQADIEFDVSAGYNHVIGMGGFDEVECTVELKHGWDSYDDTLRLTPELLMTTATNFQAKRNVWRKWVLNEAGDYSQHEPFDFFKAKIAPSATSAVRRRRRFLPTITIDANGEPAGPVGGVRVEYYVPPESSGAGVWKDVTFPCHVLDDECAVYFGGKHAPEELYRHGSSAKVRVTATIRFDTRIRGTAPKNATSPNKFTHGLTLDLLSRFKYRRLIGTGAHASSYLAQVSAGTLKTLAQDDRKDLQKYCEKIRNAYDRATIHGPVVLHGLDNMQYGVGDRLIRIAGRNIDFTANTVATLHPNIVGITYDFQEQTTTLQMEQFHTDRRFLTDAQGLA